MTNETNRAEIYQLNLFKIVVLAIVSAYFLNIVLHYSQWNFFDNVDLIIHEAGHFIFGLASNEFLAVSGGTLLQILMPLVFVLYFYATDQKFSGALTMFWLGQSFLNISVYAQDATQRKLPLLGGDGSIHDWHYLLGHLKLLSSTDLIAGAIRDIGLVIILSAIIGGMIFSREKKKHGDLA